MKSYEAQIPSDDWDNDVVGEAGLFRKSDGTMRSGDLIPAEGWPKVFNEDTNQRLLGYMPDEDSTLPPSY